MKKNNKQAKIRLNNNKDKLNNKTKKINVNFKFSNFKQITNNISFTLISILIVLTFLILGTCSVLIYNVVGNRITTDYNNNLNIATETYLNKIDELKANSIALANILANDTKIVDGVLNNNRNEVKALAEQYMSQFNLEIVLIADMNSNVIYDTTEAKLYLTLLDGNSTPDEIVKLLNGISSETITKVKDTNFIYKYNVPVYDNFGNVIGYVMVGTKLNNDALFTKFKEIYNTEFIFFSGYTILNSTIKMDRNSTLSNLVNNETLEKVFKNGETHDGDFTINGVKYNGVFKPILATKGSNGVVFVGLDSNAIFNELFNTLMYITGISLVMAAIVIYLIVLYLRRVIFKPLNKLKKASLEISKGNLNVDLDINKRGEIGQLITSFEGLVESNRHKADVISKVSNGNIETKIEPSSDDDILAHSVNRVIENLSGFSSLINNEIDVIRQGNLASRIDYHQYHGIYGDIAKGMNKLLNSLVKNFETIPMPLLTLDLGGRILYKNKTAKELFIEEEDLASILKIDSIKEFLESILEETQYSTNFQLTYFDQNGREYTLDFSIHPMRNSMHEVLAYLCTFVDQSEIKQNELILNNRASYQEQYVNSLIQNIDKLSKGQFDLQFTDIAPDVTTEDIYQSFSTINKNLNTSISSINSYIADIASCLSRIANKDLDVTIDTEYIGEFAIIKESLNLISNSLNEVFKEFIEATQQVSSNIDKVLDSSQSLNQGATEQAAAIDEISKTVSMINQKFKNSEEAVKQVSEIANDEKQSAILCDNQMQKLLQSMDDIDNSSIKISKVLKMINDISFQTNILSLNAAVEAARAGAHGKGFAVIAEDVRGLALKSADAANETSLMIKEIINSVNAGKQMADNTAKSINEILSGAKTTAKLTKTLATDISSQSESMEQINRAIDQIAQVINYTSMNAKQTSLICEELSSQSNDLLIKLKKYKLFTNKEAYSWKKN